MTAQRKYHDPELEAAYERIDELQADLAGQFLQLQHCAMRIHRLRKNLTDIGALTFDGNVRIFAATALSADEGLLS